MGIDLEKYAGHTPGPWTPCILDKPIKDVAKYVADCIAQSGGNDFYFVSGNMADGPADICHVGNGPAGPVNVQLIADAPALLAEVVRLRADLAEAVELLRRTSAEMTASGWAACDGVHSDIIDAIAKHGGGK